MTTGRLSVLTLAAATAVALTGGGPSDPALRAQFDYGRPGYSSYGPSRSAWNDPSGWYADEDEYVGGYTYFDPYDVDPADELIEDDLYEDRFEYGDGFEYEADRRQLYEGDANIFEEDDLYENDIYDNDDIADFDDDDYNYYSTDWYNERSRFDTWYD